MIISIPKETKGGETRVAISPDIVKKYKDWGMTVRIEKGAGEASGFDDESFHQAGAEIMASAEKAYHGADIILKIWAPDEKESDFLQKGQILIANCQAKADKAGISRLAKKGITCFSLDLMPRISRAQSMDILSSQSNLAGYAAVIKAVNRLNKAVPLMMTAAGTISPARVLVLGAGVAGLQAIATAKRLGAQVYASDVRPQVKEQVESLGGKFLDIASEEKFETAGGYAKETSADYQKKQTEVLNAQLPKTDILITTALIPGQKAPLLVSKEMLKSMPRGAVVVDMASESGGNVAGTKDMQEISADGIILIGNSNLATEVPASASALFAKNIYNFLLPMYQADKKKIDFNFDDELVKGTCAIKEGEIL